MSEVQTHYRTCNICEAMCGIEVKHQGEEILSIKPDKEDPFSRGHICPKAVALQDYYHDPERLKTPIRKDKDGQWVDISWEDAFSEIGKRMRAIQAEFGDNSVATYLGNPNSHNFGNAIFLPMFLKALGTNNRYSSASADQLPHHVAANYVFGSGMAISVPDINRTDFMLVIGGNPVVSNGSLMTAAGAPGRIKDIIKRGGRVVVVDPRFTETAAIASEHLAIRPEKDALLLLAMIQTIIAEKLYSLSHLESIVEGFDRLQEISAKYTPASVAEAVGLPADTIAQLARDFAAAKTAVCYSRMGASTQSFGGLCQWLTLAINIITGNLDSEGGAMFPQPAFDKLRTVDPSKPNSYGRYESRVRKLPYYNGEFPVATLVDEIETGGEGQIKALFTIAGNPVLSAPDGDRLGRAFENLDFMVSIDIYLNETTKHADIILPATHGLENSHFDVFFNSFAVSNTAKYSPPMFEKADNQKHDWEILKGLVSALTGKPEDETTPELILDMALKSGYYKDEGMSLEKLLEHPHGMDLGPLRQCATERIKTKNGNIQLAPDFFVNDLPRLDKTLTENEELRKSFPFDMISRRLVRNHNTWTHNSYRLIKGKNPITLQLHPEDAEQLKIENGQTVTVKSSTGSVQMPAEVSDEMRPGVVSIPQGWGHNHSDTAMSIAAKQPGISINSLTDANRIDELTGNAAFNGTPVAIEVA